MKRLVLVCLAVLACGCGGKSTAEWVGLLRSPDAAQRLHAARALGGRGAEAGVVAPALAETLKDPDAFVRQEAARSLGTLGPEAGTATPALRAALRDRKPAVRKAAAAALKRIDPAAATQAGVR